jgi:hypothetical protein
MIRHCVFVRFRVEVSTYERLSLFMAVDALRNAVDGMGDAHYGANVSPEGLGRGYDDGFTIDFRDAAARDAYLAHPQHQAAGAALVGAVQGGLDGILVFDLELT